MGRPFAIKEAFAGFWDYWYTASANKFFDRWYLWATHPRPPPIMAAAKDMNTQIPLLQTHIRGYRNFTLYRVAILFRYGVFDL